MRLSLHRWNRCWNINVHLLTEPQESELGLVSMEFFHRIDSHPAVCKNFNAQTLFMVWNICSIREKMTTSQLIRDLHMYQWHVIVKKFDWNFSRKLVFVEMAVNWTFKSENSKREMHIFLKTWSNLTHKCLAFLSWSSPGPTGIVPVNWFSARSSQYSFDSLPRDGGMLPLKLFVFSALSIHVRRHQLLNTMRWEERAN